MSNTERLTALASAISENLERESVSSAELKWERACLYAEARELFSQDVEFGRWCKKRSAGAGRPDSTGVISKLLLCRKLLTSEQFIGMGYASAAELMNIEAWESHPSEMAELVLVANKMSQRDLRKAVASIKKGEGFTPPPKTKEELEAEVLALKVELGILRGAYQFSETSFFHPDFKAMQLAEINKGGPYAVFFFFGTNPADINETTIRDGFRRLMLSYHPDRVTGCPDIMAAVNKLRGHFENLLKLGV